MLDSSLPVFSQQQGDITHISDSMPSQTVTPQLPGGLEPEHVQEESVSSPMDLESEGEEELKEEEEEEIELEDDGVTFIQPTIIPSETSMEFTVSVFRIVLIVR